jgi:hypothetical protein
LKFCPLDIDPKEVLLLLLLFCVQADVLDSAIDKLLCVVFDVAIVLTYQDFVVLSDTPMALCLLFLVLFSQKFEQV